MNYRILWISALIFLITWWRCRAIKEKLTEKEKNKFEKYKKVYNVLCRIIISIFILAEITCIIIEKNYSIEKVLWFGIKWFPWVILLFLWLLYTISLYTILHKITKKR